MSEEQLAKLAQNPVANQIRVPFQYSARPGRFVLKCSSSFQSSFVVEGTRRSFVECQPSEVLPDHSGCRVKLKTFVLLRNEERSLSLEPDIEIHAPDNWWEMVAEREGFEPDADPVSNQQLTESEDNSVPSNPRKPP